MKIFIKGMSCSHCVAHVKEALEGLNGITKISEVNLEDGYAVIEGSADEASIRTAIDDAGYDVTKIEK
ncbi:MAG: heavy metal-associated domain-containing protein [Selenomonadaceae bacterium]